MELTEIGAVELARRIRKRELSPVEVVDAHIARIEQVNPRINALVADRFELARAEAREKQEAKGHVPPLHGVPCTIKEFFAVEGLPQTGGLLKRRSVRATADATAVRRLREAGAIVLGVSNVPEGGLWMETYNVVYGRTHNPWDLKRTPGGSSGGEGALVASGCSPFGLGSDIGGSIRIPAAFCGVAGHKPSGRMVPNTGQFPPALGTAGRFLSSGPLARRVEDLMPILRVLAGPDGQDDVTVPWDLGDPGQVDLRDVTVVALPHNGRVRVRLEVQDAVRNAAAALAERGAKVKEVPLPRLRHAFEIWAAMLSDATGEHYDAILGQGEPMSPWRELLKMPAGRSSYSFAALVLAAADTLTAKLPASFTRKFLEHGKALRSELEEALGPNGVLLHPPYSRPAPRHRDAWRTPFDAACTAVFNVMESPVTVVPTGLSARGLPLAVQVVGLPGRDHVTIAVASALEEAFGGWKRAPL
jgi:fatty acid amide hydrolase 2